MFDFFMSKGKLIDCFDTHKLTFLVVDFEHNLVFLYKQ